MDENTLRRFTTKVDITGEGEDDCHIWTGSKNRNGYGLFRFEGKQGLAHRVMWEHANSRRIPSGLFVRHLCGRTFCVKPSHLTIGTAWDNAQDTRRHGHYTRGSEHWAVKLTDEDVQQAIEWRKGGMPYRDIADRLNISYTAIHYALNGKTWKHIDRPDLPKEAARPHIPNELVEMARRMRDEELATWRTIEAATGYTRIHLMLRLPRRPGRNQDPVLAPAEADEAIRLRKSGLSWTKLARHFDLRISRMGLYYAWRNKLRWWAEAEERVGL